MRTFIINTSTYLTVIFNRFNFFINMFYYWIIIVITNIIIIFTCIYLYNTKCSNIYNTYCNNTFGYIIFHIIIY